VYDGRRLSCDRNLPSVPTIILHAGSHKYCKTDKQPIRCCSCCGILPLPPMIIALDVDEGFVQDVSVQAPLAVSLSICV